MDVGTCMQDATGAALKALRIAWEVINEPKNGVYVDTGYGIGRSA